MPHDEQKEIVEASLIGKIFCVESMIFVMGCLLLWYGVSEWKPVSIFWGLMILVAFVVLKFARKKDWKKHWAEMDEEQQKYNAQIQRKTGEEP